MKRDAAIVIALGALLLPTAYLGAYYGMLRPGNTHIGDVIPGTGRYELLPMYRWESDAVRTFFGPAHQLDRGIFPGNWSAELNVD